MELNEYQERAMTTCMDSCDNHSYMLFGLVGEVGELFSKLAKHIRKGQTSVVYGNFRLRDISYEELKLLKSELGDCAWFVAGIAKTFGWSLEDVCQGNLDKLASRARRGVIDGNGDER